MDNHSLQEKNKEQLIEEINRLYKYLSDLEAAQEEYIHTIKALEEDVEKYRLLLDESSDPIFMFYREGRYRYVNKAFAEGVGMDIEDIIEHTIWDVFPRDEAEKRYAVVRWVFENAETRVIEVRVPRSDGDRYYLTTAKPVLDQVGQVAYVICISKEISRMARKSGIQTLNEDFKNYGINWIYYISNICPIIILRSRCRNAHLINSVSFCRRRRCTIFYQEKNIKKERY